LSWVGVFIRTKLTDAGTTKMCILVGADADAAREYAYLKFVAREVVMRIKVITSGHFSTDMQTSFLAGLTDAGYPGFAFNTATDLVEENGNYDDTAGATATALYTDFAAADSDKTVSLIIAAGGIVSALAANTKVAQTPFLVLIGQQPKFDMNAATYCGGITLDMAEQNILRHDLVVSHYGVGKKKVVLIWNKNSNMGKFEKRQWNRNNNWPDVPVTTNSDAAITAAFSTAKTSGDAVVISGDPYFLAHRDTVVSAANDPTTKQLKVCYPFSAYANGTYAPVRASSMIFGPNIELAYRLLGRKSGAILDSLSAGGSIATAGSIPDLGLETCPTTTPTFIGS